MDLSYMVNKWVITHTTRPFAPKHVVTLILLGLAYSNCAITLQTFVETDVNAFRVQLSL